MTEEYDSIPEEQPRRRTTDEYYEAFRKQQNPLWKMLLAGVLIAACSGIVTWVGKGSWEGVRSAIVNGKADMTVVEEIKQDNDKAHTDINTKLKDLGKEQRDTNRITKKIARKLKIEVDND